MFITFWVRREWLSSCLLQKFCWREVWRDVSEKPRLCVPNVAFRITESNSTILCHVVVDEHLHTIMNCNGMEQEPKRRHGHRIDSAMRPLTRRNANPRLSFGLPIANLEINKNGTTMTLSCLAREQNGTPVDGMTSIAWAYYSTVWDELPLAKSAQNDDSDTTNNGARILTHSLIRYSGASLKR